MDLAAEAALLYPSPIGVIELDLNDRLHKEIMRARVKYIFDHSKVRPETKIFSEFPWPTVDEIARFVGFAERVNIYYDVSGGIDPAIFDEAAHVLCDAVERTDAVGMFHQFDDRLHDGVSFGADTLRERLKSMRLGGGGGTSLRPLLDDMAKHGVEKAIVLTDGIFGDLKPDEGIDFPNPKMFFFNLDR